MADAEVEVEVEGEGEGEATPKKSGGFLKIIMIAAAAVVLIGVGGIVGPMALNMISGDSADEAGEEAEVAETVEPPERPDGPALYQSLLPPLVINIKDADGDAHFMQLSMEAMARDQNVVNTIREHTPVIRNNLILLYGNATYESVTTREGKEKLLSDGLAEIQSIVQPYIGDGQVEALYFTAMVVQ